MKNIYLVFIAIIIVVIGAFFYLNRDINPKITSIPTQLTPTSTTIKNYALAQVAKHADASDCWMAVEGKVYDVSSFIASGKHKGGMTILDGCGKDATGIFNSQPGTGKSHSQKAREMLAQFYIGDLTK